MMSKSKLSDDRESLQFLHPLSMAYINETSGYNMRLSTSSQIMVTICSFLLLSFSLLFFTENCICFLPLQNNGFLPSPQKKKKKHSKQTLEGLSESQLKVHILNPQPHPFILSPKTFTLLHPQKPLCT